MTTQHTCDHCPEAEKRRAAQIENEALKERLARAGLEQHRAVLAAVLAGNESAYQRGYMDGRAKPIEAALKPGEPGARWSVVPQEPTPEMMDAGQQGCAEILSAIGVKDCYQAMLAASPLAQPNVKSVSVPEALVKWAYSPELVETGNNWQQGYEHARGWVHLQLSCSGIAPPAQTPPPRLTDEQLSQVMEQVDFTYAPTKFARAIETAVRKQFLGRGE